MTQQVPVSPAAAPLPDATSTSPRRVTARPVTSWTLRARASESAGWPAGIPQVVCDGQTFPATVPGVVHTDLLPHGLVGDVAVDGSEAADAWVMRTDWRYTTELAPPSGPFARAVLVFDGIDTVATVLVNGSPRLLTADMFRRYEVDVTEDLRAGTVMVDVDLHPALELAEAAEAVNPLPRPDSYPLPYNQVRKMACSYGWDWGPTTGTAGLWKPVTLLTWSDARLTDVRVAATSRPDADPRLAVQVTVADLSGAASDVRVGITGPGIHGLCCQTRPRDGAVSMEFDVPGAQVWEPVGLGEQPLYDVTVDVLDPDGEVLDAATRRVGFRSVALVQQPDDAGISFELHVNGRRVWVRGLNWIPDDPFPSRITRERLRERIGQAVATGANLLRVWGGGTFESDDFYDVCDELGVLVWQDFLFACAAYPEDASTRAEVVAEVEDNVARLRSHPSLVVWSGCNENLWGFEEWGWQETLQGREWGATYYGSVLPDVLARVDGTRPYVPGSPFSPGGLPERADGPGANDATRGTVHIWDVWNQLDYTAYEEKFPRFAAEFGYQAPASWPTLARALGEDAASATIEADDARLRTYQKAEDGARKLSAGLARHFPTTPADGPAWYYATQLLQARAVRTGIGHLRAQHETCSGTIWWQHNDCWPSISWSIVDVAGRRKLAWYAMRESYRPVAVLLTGGRDDAVVTLVNDGAVEASVDVTLYAVTVDGEVLAERTANLGAPAGGALRRPVAEILGELSERVDLLVADLGDRGALARTTRWLRPDLELALPSPTVDLAVRALGDDEVEIELATDGLLRDACLLAELVLPDAEVDVQALTVLPGELPRFRVRGAGVAAVTSNQWSDVLWHDARLRRG